MIIHENFYLCWKRIYDNHYKLPVWESMLESYITKVGQKTDT